MYLYRLRHVDRTSKRVHFFRLFLGQRERPRRALHIWDIFVWVSFTRTDMLKS